MTDPGTEETDSRATTARNLRRRVRDSPLIAASGCLSVLVLLVAAVALVAFAGPGAPPDPGGRRLGEAILVTVAGVALLWLLVVARAVRGVFDDGVRPSGVALALVIVEGVLAVGAFAIAGAAVVLADASGDTEALAVGAYAVATVGLVLAVVSLVRAGVGLLDTP